MKGLDILGHRGPRGPRPGPRPHRHGGFRPFWGPTRPYYAYPEREVYLVTEDQLCDYYGPDGECIIEADEILGGDVFGFVDVQARQKEMNAIKQVPVSVAQVMLKHGQEAIDYAIKTAVKPDTLKAMLLMHTELPGKTARENVLWKLRWHADQLRKYDGKPNEIYPHGDDLKKWTMQAFVEANAVEEGSAFIDAAWAEMWREIAYRLAMLPKDLAQKVSEFTMPTWAKITIGCVAGVVALGVGGGIYAGIKSRIGK